MRIVNTFEQYNNQKILIIVDVQKSFRSFFTEMYINKLTKYCNSFTDVYQVWDNHFLGNVDKDFLYDEDPEVPIHDNFYKFPNQKDVIEKRYNYNVNADFYKKILSKETYTEIKSLEKNEKLKKGNMFPTKEGTVIIYVGNNHVWFHISKKLYDLLLELKGKNVTIVGGADSECLEDIYTSAISIGVNINRDWRFIYTATSCPIK